MADNKRTRVKKHPWFKRKGYLHFDFALERPDAETYVTRPENIKRHRFSPLIHYGKMSRKVRRDKAAEKAYKENGSVGPKPKLIVDPKSRNIFYASHIDGYIYGYYNYALQKAYEDFLLENNLADNVIAYRAVSKDGVKFCNCHFAEEAFQHIRSTSGCRVLCFDISKFFDKLSVAVLKRNWATVCGWEDRLHDDHFKVFESLVGFRYVEEGQLIAHLKGRFAKTPRKHGLSKNAGGSLKNRICSYPELRALDERFRSEGKRLIRKKESLQITGIPQGTALSGLLSNIFMMDFDKAVKAWVEGNKGYYRRYSDDIFIAVPTSVQFEKVEAFVMERLADCCAASVQINQKKTEKKVYQVGAGGDEQIVDVKGLPSRVQYLGFHFDGKNTTIRNSSMSKDRGKIVQLVRELKRKGKINTAEVFKRRSLRKITPFDDPREKGFVRYAVRAAETHGGSKAILRQIQKDDRFIKRAIARERARKSPQSSGTV